MTCPYSTTQSEKEKEVCYSSILNLGQLLGSVQPLSDIHDEHLFIVTHQTFELWFKQIILEIDSIRSIFMKPKVNEKNMLTVNSRLNRIVKILVILSNQIKILETMTPMDFADFRGKLGTASGYQSWQFRMIENKLGVKKQNRINYNNKDYVGVFDENLLNLVKQSEEEPSIIDLVETWLERTPGKKTETFDFVEELKKKYEKWLQELEITIKEETDPIEKESLQKRLSGIKETFEEVFDEEKYNMLRKKGDRRLSWSAFYGALMIYYYRDEVLFHEPFQMINLLMDIDCLMMKWRSNHVLLVQRIIGSKVGTGGSSGYQYLRATVSDRYKAFLDFFNLTNYLVPREYIPSLKHIDRQCLRSVTMNQQDSLSEK